MTKYMERNKILVVDDEEDLCEILQFNLESEGFAVDIANWPKPDEDLLLAGSEG